jgi:cytosine permease
MKKLKPHDDYSLSRVPSDGKLPTWKVMVVRLGCLSCLPVLMLGTTLGYSLTFWQGVCALFFGSVLLQIVGWAIGNIAAREGLATSLACRWAGFGNLGSSLIGVVIALSTIGWFGIQNSIFATGLFQTTGLLTFEIWSVITGLVLTILVMYGFKFLSLTANIALPLFVIGTLYALVEILAKNNLADLVNSSIPGPAISMGTAITMVMGSFITGAVLTPDLTRFVRTGKDVFWICLVSTFVGELGFGMIGILMSHAAKSADLNVIMLSFSGVFGTLMVIFSTIKSNNLNLYSASLGILNFFDAAIKIRLNRGTVTLLAGIIGTVLSMVGVLSFFTNFLILLGEAITPIAGIMAVDYYVLKRSRNVLDISSAKGTLPDKVETWNPVAIIAWALGFIAGIFSTDFGIPAINSLVVGALTYLVIMRLSVTFFSKKRLEL